LFSIDHQLEKDSWWDYSDSRLGYTFLILKLLKNPLFLVSLLYLYAHRKGRGIYFCGLPLFFSPFFPCTPFFVLQIYFLGYYPREIDSLRWEACCAASVRRRIKFLRFATIAVSKAWMVTLSRPR